jgi:hypothetical protein
MLTVRALGGVEFNEPGLELAETQAQSNDGDMPVSVADLLVKVALPQLYHGGHRLTIEYRVRDLVLPVVDCSGWGGGSGGLSSQRGGDRRQRQQRIKKRAHGG